MLDVALLFLFCCAVAGYARAVLEGRKYTPMDPEGSPLARNLPTDPWDGWRP